MGRYSGVENERFWKFIFDFFPFYYCQKLIFLQVTFSESVYKSTGTGT